LGPFFALGIGLAYCSMVFLSHGAGGTLAEAAVRATVLAIIGWLIAYLSARLHEREELYRGVFDNSEAGMLVVAKTGEGAVIQEANWNAARLTGRGNTPIRVHSSRPAWARIWLQTFSSAGKRGEDLWKRDFAGPP